MTVPEFALAYANCPVEELNTFIQARTTLQPRSQHASQHLPPPSRVGARSRHRLCVESLTRLDQTATFHFFDLSAELRIAVYEIIHCTDQTASRRRDITNLLLASHQTHSEASNVLYANVNLRANFTRTREGTIRGRISGVAQLIIDDTAFPFPRAVSTVLAHLAPVRTLKVHLRMAEFHQCSDEDDRWISWTSLLDFFECLLAACPRLRSLEIELDWMALFGVALAELMLEGALSLARGSERQVEMWLNGKLCAGGEDVSEVVRETAVEYGIDEEE